jgi:hypothetical protein
VIDGLPSCIFIGSSLPENEIQNRFADSFSIEYLFYLIFLGGLLGHSFSEYEEGVGKI